MPSLNELPCPVCRSKAVAGDKCAGCYSELSIRQRASDASVPKPMRCPGCASLNRRTMADGTFACLDCAANFEAPDFGPQFCDSRPENNAQKVEEYQIRQDRLKSPNYKARGSRH